MATRRSPWVLGIVIGFVVMVLVNAAFIYIAVRGADEVVPSYHAEQR
jgi:type IV secretory pathway VirB3-like protein